MASGQPPLHIELDDPLTFSVIQLNALAGLAKWAEKEMGDRYQKVIRYAFDLYVFEVARRVEKEKMDFLTAIRETPFLIPRRGVRSEKRKNFPTLEKLETALADIEKRIEEIDEKTKPCKSHFKREMRREFPLFRDKPLKPSHFSYEELARQLNYPKLSGEALRRRMRAMRKMKNFEDRLFKWLQQKSTSIDNPSL